MNKYTKLKQIRIDDLYQKVLDTTEKGRLAYTFKRLYEIREQPRTKANFRAFRQYKALLAKLIQMDKT